MRHVPATPPRDSPAVEVETVEWERIQLTISARVRGGIEPETVALHHRGATMSPTWSSLDGERLRLRFNVMLGPGQLPLGEGRWVLTHGRDHTPLRLTNDGRSEWLRNPRAFALKRSVYRVAPVPDPRTHALALDVHETPLVAGRARGGIRGRLAALTENRHPIVRLRQTLFIALARLFDALHEHNGRRILFTSDSEHALTGNLRLVHDRMIERGLDREYEIRTLFKPGRGASRSWRDRFLLPYQLSRADIVVMDDLQPAIYSLEPSAKRRIVQLWHASGAFKTVGYSRIGKPGAPDPYSTVHKNYTYAIVGAESDIPYYAEAFGLPEERVIPTGTPRMDRFFDERERQRALAGVAEAFPQIAGRLTILFAPTFRGDDAKDAHYPIDLLDYDTLHALCIEKDAAVILRMHPFVRQPLEIPEEYADRLLDGSGQGVDVNDLLFAVDLLVTDYSSIVFEFATQGRPMLFFAYDLEEYLATRDFYVRFEDFVPGRIVRTFPELLDAIRREDFEAEKVDAFRRRHVGHLDGRSTDRVIDDVILAASRAR